MPEKNKSDADFRPDAQVLGFRISALVEIAVFFFFFFLLALFTDSNFNFFSVSPHPFWIIVILISAQYGTVDGLVAAMAASAILLLGNVPERNILQDRAVYFFLLAKTPILWFVTAVLLGELRMKHIRERDRLREIALQAAEKERKIAESYAALKKIKERLEMRVASETQTTLMIISAFKQLEELGKEEILKGACDLTETLVAPEKYSLYLLESNELKRAISRGWDEKDRFAETFGTDSPLFQEIVEKRRPISIHTSGPAILEGAGVLAVPIIAKKEALVLGMIKVEQIPFLRLRTSTVESLVMIGEWVGRALANLLERKR